MIVTLTLNPSLDRTIEVDSLARGAVIRAGGAHVEPGGKGVNVSRALLANGIVSRAVLPSGGDDGQRLVRLLEQEGVEVVAVPCTGATRSNVTLVEPDGTVTKINEPGAAMSAAELDRVAAAVLRAAAGSPQTAGAAHPDGSTQPAGSTHRTGSTQPAGSTGRAGSTHPDGSTDAADAADWVVICGSLPPGVPVDLYATLSRRFAAAGIRVAVDTSGPALLAAVAAGTELVKPNREELAEAVGRPLGSLQDVVDAAQELRSWGAGTVLASLGADGAVLVGPGGVVAGESPLVEPRSTVGAGDALLAGFLAAGGHGPMALAEALAWGAAAAALPGSRMPGPADISRDHVRIQPGPDLGRPLLPSG
jgi:1-phosphofructokinase